MLKHVCIAPKNSRRVQFWKKTLEQYGQTVTHITYLDLIEDAFTLSAEHQYFCRIESAGEEYSTYKNILLLGCESPSERQQILQVEENFGEVANFDAWYKGWKKILQKISDLASIYHITFINHPKAIAHVFDKYKTQQFLIAKNISCPTVLGRCEGYESLIQTMEKTSIKQVFIKPFYGSSASGVMAFRYINLQKQILYTTIKEIDGKLYNSLNIIKYTDPKKIAHIINRMSSQNLIVEKWIPKWCHNGYSIDFRVIVINNKVEFIVARGSQHMITNIHLGNKKLRVEDVGISDRIQKKIETVALQTMETFPQLAYAGIDILLDRKEEVYVLEVNAFGDMLLGIKNKKGKTVYEQEYESLYEVTN